MSQVKFADARREQNGILATAESYVLKWLAAHLSGRINSDHLTALGFLAMVTAGIAYALSPRDSLFLHAVNVCLLLNWLGDSLDGTLARHRNRLRPRYGFYVDHMLDTFSMLFIVCGLALSGYMSFTIASFLLIAYFMLCINIYLATYTMGAFKISYAGFSPTELRLLMAIGNLVLLRHPTVQLFGDRYLLFDVGGVVAVGMMAVILILSTIENIVVLYNAERLPVK